MDTVQVLRASMLRDGTPLEHYPKFGLYVKREDRSCFPPGPAFSKTRGVFAHIYLRTEETIGVLDTFHSQAGHAVARACEIIGKQCVNFYPEYKHSAGFRNPQVKAQELGAVLIGLPAGRSAVLYHGAKKRLAEDYPGAYMMPNALKLPEMIEETAREVFTLPADFEPNLVIIPASSATIAAGVIKGFCIRSLTRDTRPHFIIHQGYSRSLPAIRSYVAEQAGIDSRTMNSFITFVDEGYSYKDVSKPGPDPLWPCNPYYDLKAFRWWMRERRKFEIFDKVCFWNVG